jgi:hypothetical protein
LTLPRFIHPDIVGRRVALCCCLKAAVADTDRPARAIWRRANRTVSFADPFGPAWYYRLPSSAS